MEIKKFPIKNLEFVDIKKIKINNNFYTGKVFLRGTSRVPYIYTDKFCYCNFKFQANTLKELKEVLKSNYDYFLDKIYSQVNFRDRFICPECGKKIDGIGTLCNSCMKKMNDLYNK